MKKKILAIMMAALSVLTAGLYGCSDKEGAIPAPPDYSDSTKQFEFYGYSSVIDGWNIDGVAYDVEEDYLSVDRIKEYKDAGMSIYFPQSAAAVTASTVQDFENSAAKRALDYSLEAGIDKVILMDSRIQALSKPAKENAVGLIGEGKQFASEAELDATIAEYMAPYKDHPAFYGVMLGDEPFYYHVENYGQVYRSIKRVCPDAFIQYNLNPITAGTDPIVINERFPALEDGEGEGLDKTGVLIRRYEKYLTQFIEATGTDYVQYDHYPLTQEDTIQEHYFLGLQVVARLAKDLGLNFYFVSQTYIQTDRGAYPRDLRQEDLYWLQNSLLGFGVKQISYFTYFTKADNNTEHFVDGQSFITWEGEKTDIYYWMQQIMAEEQKFAPVLLSFEYNTSKIYIEAPTTYSSQHALLAIETPDFTAVTNVDVNKECALVTELYDEDKGNYLYMVQNIVDPLDKGSKSFQTTVLTFDKQYKYAAIYVKGERTLARLEEGTLTLKHKPGEATFVLPY